MLFLCALIALTFAQCDYDQNTVILVENEAELISAVESLDSDQTIELAAGRYEVANLQIENVDCVVFRPQMVSGSPAQVTLDASIPLSGSNIEGSWTQNGELWSVELAAGVTVWQLFTDDFSQVSLARYPNVQGEDVWNASLAFRSQDDALSSNGEIFDELLPCEDSDSPTVLEQQPNFDGCMAVLNIGHWETIEAQIFNHQGDSFQYTNDEVTYKDNLGRYFVECLAALDAPGEWGFDWESNQFVVRLPEDLDTPVNLRGKRADFLFSVLNADGIQFQHLNFFAGGLRLNRAVNSEVSDCTFTHSSYNKRALQQSHGAPGALVLLGQGLTQNQQEVTTANVVRDCVFRQTDGAALVMQMQRGNTVRDNLFSHIDYSAAYAHGAVDFQSCDDTTFEYNTVTTTGSSETIRAGSASQVRYSFFTNGGLLQEDGAAVQVRTANQEDTIIEFNWAVNNAKKAFRFDTSNKPTAADGSYSMGTGGTMRNNVAFNNRGGITVKGDSHIVRRNTAVMNNWFTRGSASVEAGTMDMAVWDANTQFPDQVYNTQTQTRVNLVQRLSGSSSGDFVPVPGTQSGNYNGFAAEAEHVFNMLRDPLHGDFRPVGCTWPNENTCQNAHNYGAYSQNTLKKTEMWVPGLRFLNAASFALPYDASEDVPFRVDLKWQRAQDQRCKYDVYITRDAAPAAPEALAAWLEADATWVRVTTALQSNKRNLVLNSAIVNAVGEDNWVRGRTYYWRVETVRNNGNRCSADLNGDVPGEAAVWSFKLAEGEDFTFQGRGDCATMFDTFDEAEVQQTLRDFASMTNDDDIASYCANEEVDELWAENGFFGSEEGESNYFEYDCNTWECGLAMILAPVCDLTAVAEAASQLPNKKKTAKRAVAVSSNVCDLSYCDAPAPTSNDADLPTLSTDFVPSTCVIGMLESEMEQFSDLLQATIRQVFGSLTETQMERPVWASNPGDSCRDGPNFLCDDLYCDSGMSSQLQELRDTFTSDAMALLRHSASSTCTEAEVLTAAMNIGGKISFRNHFSRVHACWSSEWNTSGATRRLLAMAHA
jgi:hypothetical protein